MHFWDREQSAVFLEAVQKTDPRWYPFFLCALRTGMRLGELCALRWDDLDFVKGQIHVVWSFTHGKVDSPKNGRGRVVPMSPQLAAALKAHRHLRGPLVFCREDGSHLTRDNVKHPFDRATRRAGVRAIRIHDMRHSFASQLVMEGVPLTAVKEYLGHRELEMTMRYAHLSPDARQGYVKCLDEALKTGHGSGSWSQNGPNSELSTGAKS